MPITFSSDSVDVTAREGVYTLVKLYEGSPTFKSMIDILNATGKNINITFSDINAGVHPVTTDINGDIQINIQPSWLKKADYWTDIDNDIHQAMSLERVMAHELFHAVQYATNGYTSGDDHEWEAVHVSNDVMTEYAHETPQDTKEAIPNSYETNGARLRDVSGQGLIFNADLSSPNNYVVLPVNTNPALTISHGVDPFSHQFLEKPININDIINLLHRAETERPDPLILDLNHNGHIDLNANATVYFDTNNDGFAEAVNWVSAGDGLLARDVNANGTIDNNSELFGNSTQDGFSVLSSFDSNHDGVINVSDSIWSDLVVWKDANQDGYSQSDELLTLSSLGITGINLTSIINTGNADVPLESVVTTTAGDMKIGNAIFDADFVNTRYNEDYTLDIDTLFLPTLRGYGTIADLHIAASINTSVDANGDTIKDKLTELASYTLYDLIADPDAAKEIIQTLIYHWAGVEDASANSRGVYMDDARELLFLEKYLAENFVSFQGDANPGAVQGDFLDAAYDTVLKNLTADIFVQMAARSLFETPIYDLATGTIDPSKFVLSEQTLDDLSTHAAGLADTAARTEFWEGVVALLDISADPIRGTSGLDMFGLNSTEEEKLSDAIETSDAALTWHTEDQGVGGLTSIEFLYSDRGVTSFGGTIGSDTYTGSSSDDYINPADGNDTVYGAGGNDKMFGWQGDDTLYGGDGDDHIYGESDNNDWNGNDVLYGDAGDDTLVGGYGEDSLYGGDGNDSLWGDLTWAATGYSDILDGGSGNDILLGEGGDDILIDGYGASGQNLMDGGDGYNTFRVVGGGAEVYIDGGRGALEVPAAYTDETSLAFARVGDFLHITGSIPGSEINVYINNEFSYAYVDKIRFLSGYEYDLNYKIGQILGTPTQYDDILYSTDLSPNNTHQDVIYALAGNDIVHADGGTDQIHGGDGNDTLYGENGSDVLYGDNGNDTLDGGAGSDGINGGAGNDILIGGIGADALSGDAGDDTYMFAAGDGVDNIYEAVNAGFDTVSLVGISATDARLWTSGGGLSTVSLDIIYSATDKITAYGNAVGSELRISQQLEKISFDDGTIWNLTGGLTLTGTNNATGTEYGYGTGYDDTIHGMGGSDNLSGAGGSDHVYGDDGTDTLYGGDGIDYVYGGNGDDSLYGDAGNDILYGEAGNDSLNGGADNDTLIGGLGIDSLSGGAGDDNYVFSAGDGSDTISESASGGMDTVSLVGISVTDTRLWTSGGGLSTVSLDIIYSGADKVTAYGGATGSELKIYQQLEKVSFDDGTVWDLTGGLTLTGSNNATGTEYGYGTAYNDTIHGMGGSDNLSGAGGNDSIYGDDGNDTLNGGDGVDTLYGGAGTDTLNGDAGNDILHGGDSGDSLNGGDGNDALYGDGGSDSLSGGLGDDTYVFAVGDGADSIIEAASSGTDTAYITGVDVANARLWSVGNGSGTAGLSIIYSATDSVAISGGTTTEINVYQKLEQVKFDDNTTWDLTGGLTLTGSNNTGTEYGWGTAFGDIIHGLGGTDYISAGGGDDIVYGDAGDDTLFGVNGIDTLYGGDGADTLNGDVGNDILYGDAGNDNLNGGADNDTLYGGTGNDNLSGDLGNDAYVFAVGDGTDSINEAASSGTDTVYLTGIDVANARLWSVGNGSGTAGLSIIYSPTDSISIYGGTTTEINVYQKLEQVKFDDNTIWNLTGGLTLTGSNNSGTEYGWGTGFNDIIHGLGGTDYISAGGGDDFVYGDAGNDTLFGVNGNDTLYGGDDNDTLNGDAGNDILYGDVGNDNLNGGADNDTLYGGTGNDNLSGDLGDDAYIFAFGDGADLISEAASSGTDTVYLTGIDVASARLWSVGNGSGTAGLSIIYSPTDSITIYGGTTMEINIYQKLEQVKFDDNTIWDLTGGLTFTGSNNVTGTEYGWGTGFGDIIHGLGGMDYISAGGGDDFVYGDAGNDTLYGANGNDTMYGGADSDSLSGDAGNDILYGGDGNDSLTGGAGNDTLTGGLGSDGLAGGTNDDTYIFAAGDGADSVTEGISEGNDTVQLSDVTSSSIRLWTGSTGTLTLYSGTDTITIASGLTGSGTSETAVSQRLEHISFTDTTWNLTDGLVLTGTSSGETGYGSAYADTIHGMDGADTLYGNGGNDFLYGDGGNDIVRGGAGNDFLYASDGTDTLYGETGSDTFVFTTNTGIDTISDFSTAQGDKIDISDLLQAYDPVTHAITDWVQITTSGSNSILSVDVDGGSNSFVQIATITGVTGLTDEAALVTSGNLVVA